MRFKTGRKVEVMNKEVPTSWRKISRNNEVKPTFCIKIHQNDARLKKPKRVSPFGSSHLKSKKVKLSKKDCHQSQRKVDAFDFEGKTYMQASFNYSLNGYYEMEKNESDNDQCSVGSCSVVSDGYNKLTSQYDVDIMSSDEESYNNTSRVEQEVAESVHRLELHAYQSTLEALYASGPLSWEKEAVLTNLRINLHISNDEHLTELKHLISSGSRILD